MRYLFIIMISLFLLPVTVFAWTETRNYQTDKRFFVVEYNINTNWCTVPAIAGAQPHWGADISVYEVIEGKQCLVCKPFPGQYVQGGCFEDKPKDLVEQAIKIKQYEILEKGK